MSFSLTFNSRKADSGTPSDFVKRLDYPIQLEGKYEVALASWKGWYSYYNVKASFNNNTFRYSHDSGSTYTDIVIPNGTYGIEAIDKVISDGLSANGHDDLDSDGIRSVSIIPDYNQQKVLIQITEASFRVDLSYGLLRELLGFSAAATATPLSTSTYSDTAVDITRGVSNLILHTSLLDFSTATYDDAAPNGSIYDFVPNVRPGSALSPVIYERIYIPMNNAKQISHVRFWLTDDQNRAIDLEGQHVSITVHLRPMRD